MDLNELKNLNMDDLKAKVMAFADKKTLIKIGISLGSIIVFVVNGMRSAEKIKLTTSIAGRCARIALPAAV